MNTQVTYSTDGETIITEQIKTYAQGNFQERMFEVITYLRNNVPDFYNIIGISVLFKEDAEDAQSA